jgi:hypothetical protein
MSEGFGDTPLNLGWRQPIYPLLYQAARLDVLKKLPCF